MMMRSLLIFLLLFAVPAFAAEPISLKPYTATYAVAYRGLNAGLLHFSLTPAADNTYIYETHVEPSFLARLVVSPKAIERSVVQIDADGVRPLSWLSEDGKSGTDDDGSLTFDWSAQQVSGTVEDEAIAMPVEPGLQDRLSMQVAVLAALLRDAQPGPITMIDGDKIKQYNYDRKGTSQVSTGAGSFDTILYESTREGSSRLKRIYHAPALGYLPVRLEHLKKGQLDTVMELVAVTPQDGAGLDRTKNALAALETEQAASSLHPPD